MAAIMSAPNRNMAIRILQVSLAVFAGILLVTILQRQHAENQRQHSEFKSIMSRDFDALGDIGKRIQGQGLELMVRGVSIRIHFFGSILPICRRICFFCFLGLH